MENKCEVLRMLENNSRPIWELCLEHGKLENCPSEETEDDHS